MGSDNSKSNKNMAPPDPTEVLINMKMKSKMFMREHKKAMKEKKKYHDKARASLKNGNEEGARLFLDLVSQKQNEAMQYMRMSHRLDVIAGQVKSKLKTTELMNDLAQFTPFLEASA